MKKIIFILSVFLSISAFSQAKYEYIVKFNNITDINKEVTDWLKGMFTAVPVYNSSNKTFRINSDLDISQSLFTQKATDRNLTLSTFNKIQVVTDPPASHPTK